jgi:hypothetical protein
MKHIVISALLAVVPLCAQEIKFPASFEKLAERAEEVVNVTLDSSMLGLAGAFLKENPEAGKLVKGLQGVYVRSFEFAKEGEYSEADVEEIRSQLRSPEWSPIVSVTSKKKSGDNAQVFVKKEGGTVAGLVVLATEPKELTVVQIIGPINLADLAKLGGSFGIPKMKMGPAKEAKKQ